MTTETPRTGREVPTLIEGWAPHCGQCRAMAPDLKAVAAEFAGKVDLVEVDASRQRRRALELRVRGTPTLIGIAQGREVFRATGRASRAELREVFAALEASAEPAPLVRRADVALRAGAGTALLVAGAVGDASIALLVAGGALISWSLIPFVPFWRRSGAARP